MEQENKSYEEFLRGAEYRKTWSIAYFNSLNFAKDMLQYQKIELGTKNTNDDIQNCLLMWRDWAIEQHARYYAENIAIVGMENISPKVTEGLEKAKKAYEGKL